jgi:hypothetical protein
MRSKIPFQDYRKALASNFPHHATVKGAAAEFWFDPARPSAMAFSGKRRKPDFHYRFKTPEQMRQHIDRWIEKVKASEEWRAKKSAAKTSITHTLEEGQILYSSWGYDQTNIDFYEVTRVISDKMVEIRKVASSWAKTPDGGPSTLVVPVPGEYTGEPMRKRPGHGNACSLNSYSSAYPWDGKPKHETALGWGH